VLLLVLLCPHVLLCFDTEQAHAQSSRLSRLLSRNKTESSTHNQSKLSHSICYIGIIIHGSEHVPKAPNRRYQGTILPPANDDGLSFSSGVKPNRDPHNHASVVSRTGLGRVIGSKTLCLVLASCFFYSTLLSSHQNLMASFIAGFPSVLDSFRREKRMTWLVFAREVAAGTSPDLQLL